MQALLVRRCMLLKAKVYGTEKGWLVEADTEVSFSNNLSLTEKAKITGLEEVIFYLIETDIEKAVLGWIKVYCEKLEVEYRDLMPDFFS